MRYPPEHKQQTRDRIVRAAARRFRSRGSQGAAIGDLMRDLRLTHGGFYRHFDSKDELLAEAVGHDQTFHHNEFFRKIVSAVERAPKGAKLKALIDTYLSIDHCDDIAEGCSVAALAAELARHPPRSRARLAFESGIRDRTRRIGHLIPGASAEERERKAHMLMSGMAGTLTMARVITDEQHRRQFLEDARQFYLEAFRR